MEKYNLTRAELAALIDHTLLKPVATEEEILALCAGAQKYNFASVCVNSAYVPLVARELAGSPVKVCSVVGFPLGAMSTAAKAFEAAEAVRAGAQEIDMVINLGWLKGKHLDLVREDIRAVVDAGVMVKVIIETCYLTAEEKVTACRLAAEAGAGFVKTSTGFGTGGATVNDVQLMRQVVGNRLGVKASGGVRTLQDVLNMLAAGANRLGTSSGEGIMAEWERNQDLILERGDLAPSSPGLY